MWMVVLRIALAIVFLILGIAGLFLPILQGWLFLLISALLFFPRHHYAEKLLTKYEPGYPRLCAFLRRIGMGDLKEEDPAACNDVQPPTRSL